MRTLDLLSQFTREALQNGRNRDEIRAALAQAGWTNSEIEEAIGAPFIPN